MVSPRAVEEPRDSLEFGRISSLSVERVEVLRNRLLDLSGRNPLLNYRHPKGSSLRLVDELPNIIFSDLVANRSMTFQPVPSSREEGQTVLAAAQALGINTAYEVPPDQGQSTPLEGKHTDDRLQTLLFPAELEARLRKLRRKARTALEESGENFLYLALGFLEWFDANDSDKPRLAPLVLVPVDLSAMTLPKGSEARTCQLTYTESDFSTNVSLSEKLRMDFGITLPEINFSALEEGAVEEFSVEGYFAAVAEAVEGKQQWRVRRYASLGFFQSSNIFLWKDLAPSTGVFDDVLVKRLYDGERSQEPVVRESDIARVDERTSSCLLAVDADSSQHAAIETVFGGANLVIEGPPGTGKSQTIVNIIGASLAAGKSVLFVSEKLAALEVVRRKWTRRTWGSSAWSCIATRRTSALCSKT